MENMIPPETMEFSREEDSPTKKTGFPRGRILP